MSKKVLTVLFGVVMVAGGVLHLVSPRSYAPFFGCSPFGLPIVYVSGIAEIGVGVATLVPATRRWGTLAILILMVCFTPLHVLDVLAQHPVVGNHTIALVRLPVQFLLIWWAWAIYRPISDPRGTARPVAR